MWLSRITKPRPLCGVVIAYALVSLISMGPVGFPVSILGIKVGWLVFLDKALLALLLLGGIGLTLRQAWGRWLVISSAAAALIVLAITPFGNIPQTVWAISLHAELLIKSGLINIIPALLILLWAVVVKVPPSEPATSQAVPGATKIRPLSLLYTVYLCIALLYGILHGLALIEDVGIVSSVTLNMLRLLLGITFFLSLPLMAIFSIICVGLSYKYDDWGLATLSAFTFFSLMYSLGLEGLGFWDFSVDFAIVLYILLSLVFSIQWFFFERKRLLREISSLNPIDI